MDNNQDQIQEDINFFTISGTVMITPQLQQNQSGFATMWLSIMTKKKKWDKDTKQFGTVEMPARIKLIGTEAVKAVHYDVGTRIIIQGSLEGYIGTSPNGDEYLSTSCQARQVAPYLSDKGNSQKPSEEKVITQDTSTSVQKEDELDYEVDGVGDVEDNPSVDTKDIPF